jgi:hypothetical protein
MTRTTRPSQGWPHWCMERLQPENARFVLMICTPTYRARVENRVAVDEGRGVFWEGALIHQYIYDGKGNDRFIPVLLDDAPEDGVPFSMRPHGRYRVRAFALSDPGYEDLYRELTGQPAIVRPAMGEVVSLPPRAPARKAEPRPAAPPVDVARIDKYAPAELIGREAETAVIEEAWAKACDGAPHPFALTFVALGGEGKTSLVAKWANDLSARGWPGCEAAFAWSFYSQGTREQSGASSDLFLAEATQFFGAETIERESGHEKGKRLAKIIGARRALLILDGLEPLQYPPASPLAGQLKDDGVLALLKGLAQRNAGLCLVTTRYAIDNLKGYSATAPQRDLAPLSADAGAKLLAALGVNGTRKERLQLAADMKGHALTLEVVGGYLRDAHGGDIRKRDLIEFEEADAEEKGGHAFRAMAAYARWFEGEGEKGQRALAMLRLTGLFDRPADAGCLAALWCAPAIEGLTEALFKVETKLFGFKRSYHPLAPDEVNIVLKRLEDAKLLTVARDADGALLSIDAHPLLREYFARALRKTRPEAWQAAHRRLYEHLTKTTEDKPAPTLDDLQPLYQAVAHGCLAGLFEEARAKIYRDRILRGTGGGGFYSTNKLGAYGADLGAVACFFDPPWRRVSPHLTPADQAWLLGQAAFLLRALGRLAEARKPMRAALEMYVAQENWREAAVSAGNLSELELTLGEVGAAARYGETAVAHADRSGDAFWRMGMRTTHADALHQAGRPAEAEALFAEAEAMQAEQQSRYPLLYSLRGFLYCDLRLGETERAAWWRLFSPAAVAHAAAAANLCGPDKSPNRELLVSACEEVIRRATDTIKIAERNRWLLDIGLDHLTLARTALYAAILRGEPPPAEHVNAAVDVLRRAGTQDHLPRALLTRALHRAVTDDFGGVREDLDEAQEIAERGPMRLHLADIRLHRARLFGLSPRRPPAYPWTSPRADLPEARRLIEACGYGRRLGELEDAEAALRALPGAAS